MIAPASSLYVPSESTDAQPTSVQPLLVLIPVFNDWEAVRQLLPLLSEALVDAGLSAEVLLLDDGSTLDCRQLGTLQNLRGLERVRVLELARNLGHQRAIAVGLAWVRDQCEGHAVIICDGDGEDHPADIPRLLREYQAQGRRKIIFAGRTRRHESWLFQACYRIYQVLHWTLTGYRVRVGNFSVLPPQAVARLAVISETWNHYAAAVFNSRLEYAIVPTPRGRRLGGVSRMNFTALVIHGLSALSVFSHVIGVRLLLATGAMAVATLAALVGVLALAYWQQGAAPAWLPLLLGLLLLILAQQVIVASSFVLLVLSNRQGMSFLPLREYPFFVSRVLTIYGSE